MQGILLTRHCQVEVISIIKENPQEEVQADSWAGYLIAIARFSSYSFDNGGRKLWLITYCLDTAVVFPFYGVLYIACEQI